MEFWEGFHQFIITNKEPLASFKIPYLILAVSLLSFTVFYLSKLLFHLRKINLLKLEAYTIKELFIWCLGATLLSVILIITQIINFNLFSFLIISMTWDNIYQKLFNKANEHDLAKIKSLEESKD